MAFKNIPKYMRDRQIIPSFGTKSFKEEQIVETEELQELKSGFVDYYGEDIENIEDLPEDEQQALLEYQNSRQSNLTGKEQRLVWFYTQLGGNLRAAAKIAGYGSITAARIVINKPKIKEEIERINEYTLKTQFGIDKNAVYKEIAKIAFTNITDYIELTDVDVLDSKGDVVGSKQVVTIKDFNKDKNMDPSVISALKNVKDGINLETYSKVDALKLLVSMLGLSKNSLELTGANGGAIKMDIEAEQDDLLARLEAKLAAEQAVDKNDDNGTKE